MSFRQYQPPKKSTIPVGHPTLHKVSLPVSAPCTSTLITLESASVSPTIPHPQIVPIKRDQDLKEIGEGLLDTPEEHKIFRTFSDTQTSLTTGNSNANIKSRIDSIETPAWDVHQFEQSFQYRVNVPEYDAKMKNRVFQFISKKLSKQGEEMVNEIARVSRNRNIDNITGYVADDLFFYLLLHGRGQDLLSNIDEQLSDSYRLGRCPQGRTIRLLSLINAFCS
jgi:hypothetical protein